MRSRAFLVAGVGAAAIALAGCSSTISGSAAPVGAAHTGGGSSDPAGIHTVADLGAAVEHNTAASSVHLTMSVSIPGAGDITATGKVKFAGAQTQEQMVMALPQVGAMQMVLSSGQLYIELPPNLMGTLNVDKQWVRIDLGGSNPLAQSLGSEADLADQANPSQLINQIAAAGTITKVTQETLNGQPTTHYSITVNVAKMAQTMTGGNASEKQALSQLGITTMPFDIWVNSSNLPVKIITSFAFADPTSGQSQQVKITVNYTMWGLPVDIVVPPASQVGTLGGN